MTATDFASSVVGTLSSYILLLFLIATAVIWGAVGEGVMDFFS